MGKGKLYGVSVGPGDPELLTLKAVRVIRAADVVAITDSGHERQMGRIIAKEHLADKEVLSCETPMSRDRDLVEAAYRTIVDNICALLDQGKTVAYLVLGDASIYSSYHRVHSLVCARGYDAEIIPGVTSFCAAAARLGIALCEGAGSMVVSPASACDLDGVLDGPGTKVLMKAGSELGGVREALSAKGVLSHASMVVNCGLADERVYRQMDEADERHDYLSVIIVQEPERIR